MDIDIPADIHEERISRLIHARAIANEMLLARAIKAMKMCEDRMKYPHEFKQGDFVPCGVGEVWRTRTTLGRIRDQPH